MRLGYGDIEGARACATLSPRSGAKQKRENVLVCHGTIGANALVHQALVNRGDHVIAVVPTYQQHYSIPESIGAEVELLWLRPEQNYLPDLAAPQGDAAPEHQAHRHQQPEQPDRRLDGPGDALGDRRTGSRRSAPGSFATRSIAAWTRR